MFFYYALQLTWGLLQNLFGAVVWLFLRFLTPCANRSRFHGAFVTDWNHPYSMGLGMFIFFGHRGSTDEKEILVHEYGHTVQSILLGPLFLPVVGFPSVIWAFLPCFVHLRKEKQISYMSAYCEKWASRLGSAVTGLRVSDK